MFYSEILFLNQMKNKSVKIRKKEIFLYLGNPWTKSNHAETIYFFKKYEEPLIKVSKRSEKNSKMALVIKGLSSLQASKQT